MSISSEITRISGNVSDALTAIANKGVTVPSGSNSDDLADLIAQISGGGGSGGGVIVQDEDGYLVLSPNEANAVRVSRTADSHGGDILNIEAVNASAGGSVDAVATATWPTGDITITTTTMDNYAFHNNTQITNIYAPNLTSLPNSYQTAGMSSLDKFVAPNLTSLTYSSFRDGGVSRAIVPKSNMGLSNAFRNCQRLTLIDCDRIDTTNALCEESPNLATVIIRKSTAVTTVAGTCLYASTKSQPITIYIPKVLYDHLGDGTALDYQNATNWSTAYTNGYISFACLEGSAYESLTWWQT